MRIRLKAFSQIKKATGKNQVEIELASNSSLQNLLKELDTRYGEDFKKETGKAMFKTIINNFNVFLNGKKLKLPKDSNVKLNDKDEVVLLQPVGGGLN